ncbi:MULTISPECIES: hypothetical protein [unclassified Microbacterium]|uniref:hypothetical protein n=1 Tax=unclassified Microbacterium TaxID=2609290 RepID=UPI00214B9876|nr:MULTISPECIES: hypothetical protein [unclassified Microbacterium]MCR2785553.1 hypothetical protein [Microbacterium sp. zg.B96]WIM17459.1 hypothetical protein QNO11_07460 [Microbacterium sp. zg-B96]
MTALSARAEEIAAHLVRHETGADVIPHDVNGRQAAVDFRLEWPDGRVGALEVTLVTEQASIAWQGMAMKEGWCWPAKTSWEFRPSGVNFRYKRTRQVAIKAVALCDQWSVDDPTDLPDEVVAAEPELARFLADDIGRLKRTPFEPGIKLYMSTTAEFVEAAPADFSRVVESWHEYPHLAPHLAKIKRALQSDQRHLFVVVVSEALPVRFFTDDFDAPEAPPRGFEDVDALWVWSDYWHRYLVHKDATWSWIDFPPEQTT